VSRILFIQAPSRLLNPSLDQEIIDAAYQDDAESAKSEFGGMFRSDISSYLDDALIDHAANDQPMERPFSPRYRYMAFVDPSGGAHDSMTLGIAHAEHGERIDHVYSVLDHLAVFPAPFEPENVVRDCCILLQRFNIRSVTGDRYGGEWPPSLFRKWGITYEPSEHDKNKIYTEAVALFAQKRVELLALPKLIMEIRMLERRPRSGGRGDSVDHPPSGKDDQANAAIGALLLASSKAPLPAGQRLSRPSECLM
jgi:hypothetical protein